MNLSQLEALVKSTYAPNEHPALNAQKQEWYATKPLSGLHIVDATPVYRNTLLKYQALIAAGARLTVGISSRMSRDTHIIHLLEGWGIPISTPDTLPSDVDIILDCGGAFSHHQPHIGTAELTRTGMSVYGSVQWPVFAVDNSRIKKIETMLGTGESFFRAMNQLGYHNWKDRKMVLFGCGKVGTGILYNAFTRHASVTVVTQPDSMTDRVRQMASSILFPGRDDEAIARAVREAYVIVTATSQVGAASACVHPEILTSSSALLVNMGVEDEFGPAIPEQRVLNEKRPLNFILEEPTLLRYIDATMALHNAGALYLASHPETSGIITPPEQLETEILDITRRNGCIEKELPWIG